MKFHWGVCDELEAKYAALLIENDNRITYALHLASELDKRNKQITTLDHQLRDCRCKESFPPEDWHNRSSIDSDANVISNYGSFVRVPNSIKSIKELK